MTLLTEKEAAEKWCPMARGTLYVSGDKDDGGPLHMTHNAGNRVACDVPDLNEKIRIALDVTKITRCIGSNCMAFRWAKDCRHTLPDGQVLITDPDDEDLLDGVWWDGRYAKTKHGYLHRTIATRECGIIPDGMFVDHIDGDPLNNRRGNLRVVTKAQNAANAASRGGESQYRGVFRTQSGRWAAQIAKEGARRCLGTYDSEREAAAAYDDAAKEVHGEYARLNLEPKENSGRRGYCGAFGKVEP